MSTLKACYSPGTSFGRQRSDIAARNWQLFRDAADLAAAYVEGTATCSRWWNAADAADDLPIESEAR